MNWRGVLEIAWWRTSPRHSGGDISAAKVYRDQWWARQIKLKSKIHQSYYSLLFISTLRFVSIPTPYICKESVGDSRNYWKGRRTKESVADRCSVYFIKKILNGGPRKDAFVRC